EPVIKRIRILNDLADFTVPDVLVAALPDEAEWAHNLSFEATQHFAVLIPYLSGTTLESLLQVARMVHDKRAQVETLAGLAPYLSAPRRDAAIARAVALEEDEALEREDRYRHSVVLARLARRLAAEGHADEAVGVAEALPHSDNVWPSERFDALTQVGILLAVSDLKAALRAVARISRNEDHRQALATGLYQVPER